MFTLLTVFFCLLIYPFLLGPARAFHRISEAKRYVKEYQAPASEGEVFLVKVFMGLFTVLYFFGGYTAGVTGAGLLFWLFLFIILSVFYLIKIGRSILSGSPISIFMTFTLKSKTMKILALVFICTLYLAVLETLHVIPTYLRLN